MPCPPDSKLADIHVEVCRRPPLRSDDTLVKVFEIIMQHPTLPNLDKTEKITPVGGTLVLRFVFVSVRTIKRHHHHHAVSIFPQQSQTT